MLGPEWDDFADLLPTVYGWYQWRVPWGYKKVFAVAKPYVHPAIAFGPKD
jgi:hypothetical protein